MVVNILNYLDKKKIRKPLLLLSKIVYFLKGNGNVKIQFHKDFRAYSYKVNNIVYLSMGPGWACSYAYLFGALKETYNFYYTPVAGDCIIDIGAGLGEESVIYSQLVGENGKVFAIEANPTTFQGLCYMNRENNFKQTFPFHLAIYNEDGQVFIEDSIESYLSNTIQSDCQREGTKSVPSITLDSFVGKNNIKNIDFLKANIEGAEQFLIEGMSQSVEKIRHLCVSCHDFRHVYNCDSEFYLTKKKVISFLEQNNFEVFQRATGNPVVDDFIYGKNRKLETGL